MATVDTLLVRIEADLKDVNQKLAQFDRRVDSTQKSASRGFGKIATAAKAVFAAAIVMQTARAGLALVKFASGVEEMQAKSSVVFGEFTKTVRSELEAFGDSVGRSTHELEGMAASVQDTFVPLGFARGEAAQLSTQLTKLAVDVASFNNASDTETMAAFQSAIVGNHETVRRFGIIITEATLQQELFRMGINKTSQEATNQEKVQARLNLIMAGTTDAQGDAARTSGSFANQSKALTAALEELAVNVLTPLLPALSGIVGGLVDATNATNQFLTAIGLLEEQGDATVKSLSRQAEIAVELKEKEDALAKATERLQKTQAGLSFGEFFENLIGPDGDFALAAGSAKGFQNQVAGLKAEIAALRGESSALQEAAEMMRRAGRGTTSTAASGDTAATPAEIKAREKVQDAIDGMTNANKLLTMELENQSPALIEQERILQSLGAEGQARADTVLALALEEQNLKTAIDAKNEAEREAQKLAAERLAQNEKGKEQLDALIQKEAILKAQIEGKTAAEIAQIEAAFNMGNLEGGRSEEILKQIEANAGLTAQLKKKNEAEQLAEGLINSVKTEEEKLLEVQQTLNQALADGGLQTDVFNQANAALEQKLKEMDPTFQNFKRAAEQAADSVADSLADGLMEGKLSLDGFQDIFRDFVKQLIKEAIKTFIIKQILGAATGGFSFGFGGGGSVGGGTDNFMAFAKGGRIPARATGGPVLVGERGPELFIPHSAGVIRNNHDSMNMMGGGQQPVVNQTINVTTGVAQTVRAEVMSMMPRIKQETIGAMIDGKKRGNAVSKAFS
jgi:hypothetical protein